MQQRLTELLPNGFFVTCIFFLFFSVCCPGRSHASEQPIAITAEKLEYFAAEKKYVAIGSVRVEKDGAVITSDRMIYYDASSDLVAEGDVKYDDENFFITAARAEVNMGSETGVLYDAEILYKMDNYHLKGERIEKLGKDSYYSPDAAFTTCDAPLPAWCFRGKEVKAVIGERIRAKDVSFRIRGLPVLYSPYFSASLSTERKTGFLRPGFGHSDARGFELSLPFFWAIAENRDATFVLDGFSKRGVGTGLEYRFVRPGGISSNWWVYHIRDSELNKDFLEITALHEERHSDRMGGYLNINYVNEEEFYREFNPYREIRIQRFLESTGEINVPFENSRLYLLSQYRVDLGGGTNDVSQRLPEAGYVLNYSGLGHALVSASLDASHFWRDDGVSVLRTDVYPQILHSAGRDVVLSQKAALRGTSYSFYRQAAGEENSVLRAAFEYEAVGHTRFFRNYASFTHVIEPAIRYHFISSSEDDLPVFDSTELFGRTSEVEFSIVNRGMAGGRELLVLRLSQAIDTDGGDRPFLPLRLDAVIQYPLPLRMEATYDVHAGEMETVTSELAIPFFNGNLYVGERYNRKEDILMYTAGGEFSPHRSIQMAGSVWYDAERDGLRDLFLTLRYLRQCWGIKVEAVKRPGDFSLRVLVELLGLGARG
jgi:LPS-assembly protein